ncbi:MAG: indole-3-glycerol-phosphate synthase [Cenarchaeum symbiont of Oopsacas minuta]|nr:indole-3-glycerol-phosphate synthase [Cenarchaeum symbiont of Oopsacas minuta]
MSERILDRLVENSRNAIDSGVYRIKEDFSSLRSNFDLKSIMLKDAHPTLICEIKYSSPSAGQIRHHESPVKLAQDMIAGGASALSILTQPHMFSGSPENLIQVRRAIDVPILMKDIIIDTVQIDAAEKMGADYILLIQAAYADGGVEEMIKYAHLRNLKVLLEVHTEEEMDCALRTRADLIGVNNRSLQTMQIDTRTVARLLKDRDGRGSFVAESGIKNIQDISMMHAAGASAFLVGSKIMMCDDVRKAVKTLTEAY